MQPQAPRLVAKLATLQISESTSLRPLNRMRLDWQSLRRCDVAFRVNPPSTKVRVNEGVAQITVVTSR